MALEPAMTYGRLFFLLSATAYIAWGAPGPARGLLEALPKLAIVGVDVRWAGHRLEDVKLERKFGPAYGEYRSRVAAFVPFLF
eukprot:tig00001487_g8934.t1